MAAGKLLFPRRWYGGMISTDLEVIWEIPAEVAWGARAGHSYSVFAFQSFTIPFAALKAPRALMRR